MARDADDATTTSHRQHIDAASCEVTANPCSGDRNVVFIELHGLWSLVPLVIH
jgi:hypothetical protein